MVTIIAKNIDIARFQINLKTNCEGHLVILGHQETATQLMKY